MKAVVLLSGGLDSATTLAVAKADGATPYALSFRYGQRHSVELTAAARLAESLGAAAHLVLDLDLRPIGGSALTAPITVPKRRRPADMAAGIPVTYVPARNTIFLSLALAWAETLSAAAIYIGVNALDYSGYPDCRPEFIEAFAGLARLATAAGVTGRQQIEIRAPLIELSKSEIIRLGTRLGVDYAETSSCYDPGEQGRPCGECDACLLRAKGFADAGLADPLLTRFGTS